MLSFSEELFIVQLEDAEFATAAAVKARKGFEMEVAELQQQMDDIGKSKQEVEDRYMALSREKNDIQSQLDDHEEEYAELMKKYKAAVAQVSLGVFFDFQVLGNYCDIIFSRAVS